MLLKIIRVDSEYELINDSRLRLEIMLNDFLLSEQPVDGLLIGFDLSIRREILAVIYVQMMPHRIDVGVHRLVAAPKVAVGPAGGLRWLTYEKDLTAAVYGEEDIVKVIIIVCRLYTGGCACYCHGRGFVRD
ncbi:MAG: hypothetical protein LBR74_09985 [Eubacterium sp.]|nr:hypothetical protein [Eubacterium sp.]